MYFKILLTQNYTEIIQSDLFARFFSKRALALKESDAPRVKSGGKSNIWNVTSLRCLQNTLYKEKKASASCDSDRKQFQMLLLYKMDGVYSCCLRNCLVHSLCLWLTPVHRTLVLWFKSKSGSKWWRLCQLLHMAAYISQPLCFKGLKWLHHGATHLKTVNLNG